MDCLGMMRHREGQKKKEMNGEMFVKQQIAFQCKCEKHDDSQGKGSWVVGRDCRGSEDAFGK